MLRKSPVRCTAQQSVVCGAQAVASTSMLHHDRSAWLCKAAPEPRDIIWGNLGWRAWERQLRSVGCWAVFFVMVAFYLPVVTAIQALLQARARPTPHTENLCSLRHAACCKASHQHARAFSVYTTACSFTPAQSRACVTDCCRAAEPSTDDACPGCARQLDRLIDAPALRWVFALPGVAPLLAGFLPQARARSRLLSILVLHELPKFLCASSHSG